jgi:hypothetical protein
LTRIDVAMERLDKHVRGDATQQYVFQVAFSVDPLRGCMTRPTEFCSEYECSAVEGAVVEF